MCIVCSKDYNTNLKLLNLSNCDNLTSIPKELINLEELYITKCYNFESIPKELNKLKIVHIHYYNLLKTIPYECQQIEEIEIDYHSTDSAALYLYSKDRKKIFEILTYIYNLNL